MDAGRLWCVLLVFSLPCCASSIGHDSRFRSCLSTCQTIGCVGSSCLPSCNYLNSTAGKDSILQAVVGTPLLSKWRGWICKTECDYHCLLSKEAEDAGFQQEAIGYRDDWCLARSVDLQEESKNLYLFLVKAAFTQGFDLVTINEPASAAFSALNILGNIIGLVAFLHSVHYSLPDRHGARDPYPYTELWTRFGVLSIMHWFSRCVLHIRGMAFDKHLDASFEILLSVYALCVAIMRVGNMRSEASRVIVAAPAIAFLYTHLMYINYCIYDFGLNMQFSLGLGVVQYLIWIGWAANSRHPGRYHLYMGIMTASLILFLRLSDIKSAWPPFTIEPGAAWIATTMPLTFIWWSFAMTDAADPKRWRKDRKRGSERRVVKKDE